MRYYTSKHYLFYIFSLIIFGCVFLFAPWNTYAETQNEAEQMIRLVFFNPDTTSKNPIDATNALQSFANVVAKKIHRPIRAYFFKKQTDLERFLSQNKVQYAVLSQIFLVENYKKMNFEPFAVPIRNGKNTYRKIVVVRKDSPYNDLQDLKGKVIAATSLGDQNYPFYNKVVFRGEIDIKKHFKEIKIVDSINSAMLAVLYSQADAAVVTLTGFTITKELNPQIEKHLKSIFTSEETPISPMVYFKDNVDMSIHPKLTEILLHTHEDPVGRQSCLAFNVEAWVRTSMDDYRETERILKTVTVKKSAHETEAKADTASQVMKGAPKTAIRRSQVFADEEGTLNAKAWLFIGENGFKSDSMYLSYKINGGKEQKVQMKPLKNDKGMSVFIAKTALPKKTEKRQSDVITYKVRPGDTLGKIADKFLGSSTKYMLLVRYNNIKNPNLIFVDQELKIKTGEVTVTEVNFNISAKDSSGKVQSTGWKKTVIL